MASSKLDITVEMVKKLIAEQFPQWAHLPIKPVAVGGHDNRTFHLGDSMSVRLPSDYEYVPSVEKEQKWLPLIAKHLSIPISRPIALGQSNDEYPFPWSVYQWIEGISANMLDLDEQALQNIAQQLAQFLQQLHCIDPTDGPVTDRGGSVVVYDDEARSSIAQLNNLIDAPKALSVWNCAISSRWQGKPVWTHGDLSAGNILVKDGQLCAVIDFGGMTIGDPACDLVIAWTLLHGESRALFKSLVNADADTWHRAAGWALWKAYITLVTLDDKDAAPALKQLSIIHDILDEY